MAVPRANLGGPFGGGTIVPTRHIDVAPILDSILGGTSTLMHQAYLRRVGQRQYELEFEKLRQEHEMRMATLQMIGAYHQAMIGAAQQRIAAKPAAVVQAQRTAMNTLAKESPDHHLIERDDAGNVLPYDPSSPKDFIGALGEFRKTREANAAESQRQKDRLAYFDHAQEARVELAGLREKWKKEDAKSGATASAAQNRLRANDFLSRIGAQFQGDYEKMAAFIGSDPEASRDAQNLGVADYMIRGTASQISGKEAAKQTEQNIRIGVSGMAPAAAPGAPTVEDVNRARQGYTITPRPLIRPTTPPSPLAQPSGATWPPKPDETTAPASVAPAASVARGTLPAAAPAASLPTPLATPAAATPAARPNLLMTPAAPAPWPPERPTPGVDLAPTPITPLAKPQVPFQAQGVPPGPPPPSSVRQMVQHFDANRQPLGEPYEVDAQGKRVVPPAVPGGLKPAWKPGQPTDENTLSPGDLWDHKRMQGLTPEAATAYVKGTTRIKLSPPPKPEDEQENF